MQWSCAGTHGSFQVAFDKAWVTVVWVTAQDTSLLPAPLDSTVVAREEAGGVLAVRIFSGLATEESAVQEEAQLR